MKKKLTETKIALIAGAASVLTSAIHATVQVLTTQHYNALAILFYVIGFVVGELPSALICFGLVYGFLRVRHIHGDGDTT